MTGDARDRVRVGTQSAQTRDTSVATVQERPHIPPGGGWGRLRDAGAQPGKRLSAWLAGKAWARNGSTLREAAQTTTAG